MIIILGIWYLLWFLHTLIFMLITEKNLFAARYARDITDATHYIMFPFRGSGQGVPRWATFPIQMILN